MIKSLRDAAAHNNLAYQFSSIELLDDTVCINITGKLSVIETYFKKLTNDWLKGFSKNNFVELHSELKSLRDSDQRTTLLTLAVFLFWLKTGLIQ